jgi:signal peptidase I
VSDLAPIPNLPETEAVSPSIVNVKQRLAAAGLSALAPGWGQLRLGYSRKGSILLGALIAFLLCFWPLHLPRYYAGIMSLAFCGFFLFNFAVFNALFSRDPRSGSRLKLHWLPLGVVLGYVGLNVVFTAALFGSGFRTVRCTAVSMEPLLMKNDRFVYNWRYYSSHPKARGDVVILRRQNSLVVKRIIAIGGDTIQGRGRTILLNDSAIDEPYIQCKSPRENDPATNTFGPVTLPPGKYFVMGDNREMSLDSRDSSYGPVSDDMIVGRALYFYKVGFGNGLLTRRLN